MDLQSLYEEKMFLGCSYVWADVPLTNGYPTFIRGSNSLGVEETVPRPNGGIYLGAIGDGGCRRRVNLAWEGQPVNGSTYLANPRIQAGGKSSTVRGTLQLTADPLVRKIVCEGPISYNEFGWSDTDILEMPQHSLLVVDWNRNNDYFVECDFYYNGVFTPAEWTSGGLAEPVPVEMEYTAIMGYQPNSTCLRIGGLKTHFSVNKRTLQVSLSTGDGSAPSATLGYDASSWYLHHFAGFGGFI